MYGSQGPLIKIDFVQVSAELNAMLVGPRSSPPIEHGPCAHLVRHLYAGGGVTNAYLYFTQLVRDLVRLL